MYVIRFRFYLDKYIFLLTRKKYKFNVMNYWDGRYYSGGDSGAGSENQLAIYKSEIINQFVRNNKIENILEFGCGDGRQLNYAEYPSYIGIDISSAAVNLCKIKFKNDISKEFMTLDEYEGLVSPLVISLDVIFHLVEDDVFEDYMRTLFDASQNYVIIYSSNKEDPGYIDRSHVRHRKFTEWIINNKQDWRLINTINNRYPFKGSVKNGSFSDFYFYKKII